MPRCAFLTLDDPTGYVIDDELAYEPLRALGWHVELIPWRRPDVRWGDYDAVVIRSTWDYQHDPAAFLEALGRIEGADVPLYNRLDLVRWNLNKTYLRDLERRGLPVVPTLWLDRLAPGGLAGIFEAIGADAIVVKPVVSANADGTFRIDRRTADTEAHRIEMYFAERQLMAQPFVHAVVDEGEFSLFYFNGEFSHAILKTPREADFRVQEEHGGRIRPVEISAGLRSTGDAVLDTLEEPPLYARVDLVRANGNDDFRLMELELIEPALYFRMDAAAAARFARALDDRAG